MLNSNIELLTQIADSSHIGILVVDKKRNDLFVNNRLYLLIFTTLKK